METEKMRSLMIDHIDGILTGELRIYVENHINRNPDAKKEFDQLKELITAIDNNVDIEVPKSGKTDFLTMLEEQKNDTNKGKIPVQKKSKIGAPRSRSISISKNFYRIAAAVTLLVIGYFGGMMLHTNKKEMEALRMEMNETRELMMMSMMKESSASGRLKGVLASFEITDADDEILNVLIQTMNNDNNINVRIAAVEALGKFAANDRVRKALIESLGRQESPAVQLKLIALLVQLQEKRAVEPLQKIINNNEVIPAVKDEAQYGIFKLM